jgi:CheY-like chemotaxis protein/molybdopterin converting factor small subunit
MISYYELIKNINVLIADDDEDYVSISYNFLLQLGYNVDIARDGKEALDMLSKKEYQILLLDFYMPILNGEEVVQEIRKTDKELVIILQTGFSGQKPPIESMQKLNIQNYHDKTEGIDKLNLELISAVKIFNQQNEIELTKYKSNALGNLVSGIAQEIKSNLLSISAGLDYINLLIKENPAIQDKTTVDNLNRFYNNNKNSLEKIDKVLNSVISQSKDNCDYIISDKDVLDIIKLVITNDSKQKGIIVNTKAALKTNSYLTGSVNDNIFMVCEIIRKLTVKQEIGSTIDLVLTEDESNWYFILSSSEISNMSKGEFYLIKKVALSIRDTDILRENDKITISMTKTTCPVS